MPSEKRTQPPRWIPDPLVAKRYAVNPRTLRRWDEDPELGFPPVIVINTRRYRELAALEDWERRTAARARTERARRLEQSGAEVA
jgi:primosomal protein N''